ncbi:MAG: phage integrase N-terminal SAM-like domain-containing protein, partial [Friedmanniella sp.]
MAIRLEDVLASFQRHLRAAAKAPRTIELYSQSVRYFSRWLTDRGREPVLDELTRHAIAAWLAELAETAEPSTVATRLEDLLASFRRHLRAAAKAPRTMELYSQSVRYFTRWLADRGRPATL